MKVTELRIGNIVLNGKNNNYNIVSGNTIHYMSENNTSGIVLPLRITKQWLSDLGFTDLGYGEFFLKGITIDFEYTDNGEFYFVYQNVVLNSVFYVHELQNLYFAITGLELEIK